MANNSCSSTGSHSEATVYDNYVPRLRGTSSSILSLVKDVWLSTSIVSM